jgi:hypothetical protein
VGCLFCVIAGGEQRGDLVFGKSRAGELGADLALAFWAVAGSALGFERCPSISERRQSQRYEQCNDEKQN